MAQWILRRSELNRGDGRHKQGFGWSRPLRIRTDVLSLQLGRVVEGQQRRGCFVDDEVRRLGRYSRNIGYPGVQGEMGRSWTRKTL